MAEMVHGWQARWGNQRHGSAQLCGLRLGNKESHHQVDELLTVLLGGLEVAANPLTEAFS